MKHTLSWLLMFWIALLGIKVAKASDNNDSIKVYDSKGTEHLISREFYRTNVLPERFRKTWNDKDALYSAIVTSLHERFYLEALEPAKHYQTISKDAESASNILGIIYTKLGRLKEAKDTLQAYLDVHGDSGVIITNLAKVIAAEGNPEESIRTLWRALEVDPNQHNALIWWSAIHYEKGGLEARNNAIRKVAELHGSWRPQLWIARIYLEAGEKDKALDIYESVLSTNAASHGDVLMMITGDLGNRNFLNEALKLVGPIYNSETHGIEAGRNLVMMYKQLGRNKEGLALLAKLEALQRYDWAENLSQLRNDLTKH